MAEEVEEIEDDHNNNNISPRDTFTPTTNGRVPSQNLSRAVLLRTPARELDKPETPLEFPQETDYQEDSKDILITELKESEEASDVESDDEVDIVLHETNKPQYTEEDYDTDLEIDGESV